MNIDIVHISWNDPVFSSDGWSNIARIEAIIPSIPSSLVGHLIFENDDAYILAAAVDTGQVLHLIKIFKKSVITFKVISNFSLDDNTEIARYIQQKKVIK